MLFQVSFPNIVIYDEKQLVLEFNRPWAPVSQQKPLIINFWDAKLCWKSFHFLPKCWTMRRSSELRTGSLLEVASSSERFYPPRGHLCLRIDAGYQLLPPHVFGSSKRIFWKHRRAVLVDGKQWYISVHSGMMIATGKESHSSVCCLLHSFPSYTL